METAEPEISGHLTEAAGKCAAESARAYLFGGKNSCGLVEYCAGFCLLQTALRIASRRQGLLHGQYKSVLTEAKLEGEGLPINLTCPQYLA